MTQRSGNPCSGPTSTSVWIPRIVRVIGAHVTELNTAMAASRVRMQTGRRPAGGPRSAQMMSLRTTKPAQSAQRDGAPPGQVQDRLADAGTRRSTRSAAASPSAAITAVAPRRISSERFVPSRAASHRGVRRGRRRVGQELPSGHGHALSHMVLLLQTGPEPGG